jgi:hypothetical protein
MHRHRLLLGLAVILLSGCSGGSFSNRVTEPMQQTFLSDTPVALQVNNIAGTVHVIGWAQPRVDVNAMKYAGSKDELKSVSVNVQHAAPTVTVTTSISFSTANAGVDYTIRIPAASSVRVSNDAGIVRIDGVGGDVNVQSQAGSVTATLPRVDFNRSITLHSTTGVVTLNIPKDSNATVRAVSTVGSFSSDFPIAASRNNVVGVTAGGKIGSGSGKIDLSTTTGAIGLHSSP